MLVLPLHPQPFTFIFRFVDLTAKIFHFCLCIMKKHFSIYFTGHLYLLYDFDTLSSVVICFFPNDL
jgi:hypothetical protein